METNKRIIVDTSIGKIIAEKLTDPVHPGIVVSLKLPYKDGTEIDLVVVEHNKLDKNIGMYIFSNIDDENWQHKFMIDEETIKKLVKQFDEEGDDLGQ